MVARKVTLPEINRWIMDRGGVSPTQCMLVVFLLLERSSLRPNPASTQTTIMADTVAKAALGPRPGPYILKFWQGSVEIVLRGLVVVSEWPSPQ